MVTDNVRRGLLALTMALLAVKPAMPAPLGTQLYFGPGTQGGGIYRLDLASPGTAESIVPVDLVNTSTGIAVDYFGRALYWIADTQFGAVDKIRRSNLDGSDVELFVTPAGQPAGLRIDPYHRKLYWSERFTDSINVVDLDGGTPQQIVSTDDPRGMELDLVHGYLYWVELGGRLRRARLDGSDVTDVITTGMTRPFDVTVDPIHQRLYWVELGDSTDEGKVWTANIDGSFPMLVAHQQGQPTDLVVDWADACIYWNSDSLLQRADLDGSNVTVVSAPAIGYRNLALDVAPPVPEPGTLGLLGAGALGLLIRAWRRR